MATIEEQIEKMYASNLASQKEQLEQDYKKADSDLSAQQEKAKKITDVNLTRTAVESQKAAVNNAELHNAYGLSSGTRAQARLAQENQLQADLTALRAQQQETDAEAERQRGLLSQEFASAIRQAQAENDLAKAQALYERAQLEEERLLAQQQSAAQQQAAAQQAAAEQRLAAAKLVGEETGDYTLYLQLAGFTQDQINKLNGAGGYGDTPGYYDDSQPASNTGNVVNTFTSINGGQNDLIVDESSVLALGYGPISEARLDQLVAAGEVEEYVEGNKIKFRKVSRIPGISSVSKLPFR